LLPFGAAAMALPAGGGQQAIAPRALNAGR